MTTIADAWAVVEARVTDAARRSGRRRVDVRVVAATKTVPAERIAELVSAGCTELGENRAQELMVKAPRLAMGDGPTPTWHFIGALQRNKVKPLVPWVSLWQTVDRPALVAALAAHAPGAEVLIEVNQASEPQKSGCLPGDVDRLVDRAFAAGLAVRGLMTVPPRSSPPRRWFAALAEMAHRLGVPELSMGMSNDFDVAIEEGATIVRLGRVLFGDRPT